MAITIQYASQPLPGDVARVNYSGTDIPANIFVQLDATNVVGVSTNTGVGVVIPTAAGAIPHGIGCTMETLKAGDAGRVRTQGDVLAIANGAVTAGQVLMISTTAAKLGWVSTQTAAQPQCGIALSSAADGESVLVQIAFAKNA